MMPSVFDSKTKTELRVKDPQSDQKLPNCGALGFGSINTETALSGTTGADCIMVNGDRWQQMKGSLTENYSQDKKIDVQGKHREIVNGDRSVTVTSGNMTRTVSAGKVTDSIAQSHESTVGTNFKVQAGQNIEETAGAQHRVQATMVQNNASATATNQAGGILTIQGSLVKINC